MTPIKAPRSSILPIMQSVDVRNRVWTRIWNSDGSPHFSQNPVVVNEVQGSMRMESVNHIHDLLVFQGIDDFHTPSPS